MADLADFTGGNEKQKTHLNKVVAAVNKLRDDLDELPDMPDLVDIYIIIDSRLYDAQVPMVVGNIVTDV